MQHDIQAVVSAYFSSILATLQKHVAAAKTSDFWRDKAISLAFWKDRFIDRYRHASTRMKWHMGMAVILVFLGLFLALQGTASSQEIATDNGVVPEEMAVLCIGVVRYRNGVQDAFFQRPGESIAATLMEQSEQALVDEGFTVEHRNCYDSWQAAADFLTDGQVTLPEDADEEIFSMTLLKWKQRQMQGGN